MLNSFRERRERAATAALTVVSPPHVIACRPVRTTAFGEASGFRPHWEARILNTTGEEGRATGRDRDAAVGRLVRLYGARLGVEVLTDEA